jgi:hypothetical protein
MIARTLVNLTLYETLDFIDTRQAKRGDAKGRDQLDQHETRRSVDQSNTLFIARHIGCECGVSRLTRRAAVATMRGLKL